jgi:hypothetical protein
VNLRDQSTVHVPLAINDCDQLHEFGLRESSLLLAPRVFSLDFSRTTWISATCPLDPNGPELLHASRLREDLYLLLENLPKFLLPNLSIFCHLSPPRRWMISLSSGLQQVLDSFAHLAQIFFLSRLRLFSNSFCTPCRVLRRLFCDFARLENLQSSSVPL